MSKPKKRILITGGSGGIGKALAQEFGQKGYQVFINGRNPDKLEQSIKALSQMGVDVSGQAGDISKQEDAHQLVEKALERMGGLDVLINNAGISMRTPFKEADLSVIRQVMEINFFGTVYVTKYALNAILKSQGSIVGISSVAGHRGLPGRTAYSASKAAMNGFLESLRTEVMHEGVHVLTVSPGYIATEIRKAALTDDGSAQGQSPREEEKMMTAEEAAKKICKAIEKKKRDLVLTRLGKATVWLNKIAPKFMDKKVYDKIAEEEDNPFQKK